MTTTKKKTSDTLKLPMGEIRIPTVKLTVEQMKNLERWARVELMLGAIDLANKARKTAAPDSAKLLDAAAKAFDSALFLEDEDA